MQDHQDLYGASHALAGVDATVARGEFVAIMGASGSGNTRWNL